jgi:hypothetical protein
VITKKLEKIRPLEGGMLMEKIIFKKRVDSREGKYQVRFWTSKNNYSAFKRVCEKRDLVFQDVFENLMEKFIEANKSGNLQIEVMKDE